MKRLSNTLAFLIAALLACMPVAACADKTSADADKNIIRLATTTSTDHSGLLADLLPRFRRDSGYTVQVVAVGTGKALKLGENGDVDVLLVHAPESERRFMELGYGVNHRQVMANDFVIVGPPDDPAGVRRAKSAAGALRRLHQTQTRFISRGDDSGTHKKELALWQAAGINNWGPWRLEVGRGMGSALQVADELRAYLLIDRGTWIFMQHKTSLAMLYEGGGDMHNPYGIIAVNPARHRVNHPGALAFIRWLTSADGQTAIGEYTVRGEKLFTPAAVTAEGNS